MMNFLLVSADKILGNAGKFRAKNQIFLESFPSTSRKNLEFLGGLFLIEIPQYFPILTEISFLEKPREI
jgi:hypothetical protein